MSKPIPGKRGCPCGNPQPFLGEDEDYSCVECRHCGRRGPIMRSTSGALEGWNERVLERARWLTKITPVPDPFPVPLEGGLWKIEKKAREIRNLAYELENPKLSTPLLSSAGRLIKRIHALAEEISRFGAPADKK